MPSATGRSVPLGLLLLAGCACLGLVLVIDGLLAASLDRYRFAAYAIGGMMTLPLATVLLFGQRGRRLVKFVAFAGVPSLALLLVAEIGLRTAGLGDAGIKLVADTRLGHRMVPNRGAADAWGFRNKSVPDAVDVVFLGDSQIFGFGVESQQSIPSQFERLSGRSSQNLGLVDYGPVQYRELSSRCLGLQPQLLVIGFYLGNDFIDAYSFAHLESASDLRLPGIEYPEHRFIDLVGKKSPNLAMTAVDFLRDWSILFEMAVTGVRNAMLHNKMLAKIYQNEPGAPAHETGKISTLFTPAYRLGSYDVKSDSVREGMRITDLCLAKIGTLAAQANVPVMLLLIHTKEYYYQQYYRDLGNALPALSQLAAAEQAATQRLVDVASRSKMMLVDPSAEMVASLNDDQALWPSSSDGHPNAKGYAVFAEAVVQAWQELQQRQGR